MARTMRLLLNGVGNVGRRLLELLLQKRELLRSRLDLEWVLVGAADRSGAALDPAGLDAQQVVQLKLAGRGAAEYPGSGRPAMAGLEMVQATSADLFLEASPANLVDGRPGLPCIELALQRGMHIVTANKSPLVLAYPRLLDLARSSGRQLRFSATVGGGLPAVNLGQRDLVAAVILRLEGILNLTSNYILTRMAQDGLTYAEALAHTQAAGHAETDPRMDVEGWDAASKLVILAHSVLGFPAVLSDVVVEGITGVTPEVLARATAAGKRVKPLAIAQREGERYYLRVGPVELEAGHPLAGLGPEQMGIVYHTDINGVLSAAIVEETPVPTAGAMLRDIVDVARSGC